MRKFGGLLLIGVLALTACSAPTETATEAPATSVATPTAQMRGLLSAEQPAANTAPAPAATTGTEEDVDFFLRSARSRLVDSAESDQTLIALGREACEQMRSGKAVYEVVVTDPTTVGEFYNGDIAAAASDGLCVDTIAP